MTNVIVAIFIVAVAICPARAQESKMSSANTPAASQPAFDYQPTPDEKELLRLSQVWMDIALRDKDEKRLREMMDPQFTLQVWDATRAPQPLEMWLKTLRSSLEKIEFEYGGLNARVFGDVGVVYSRFWWKGTMNGKPFNDGGLMTDVWVRSGGKWRVLARRSAGHQQLQAAADMQKR